MNLEGKWKAIFVGAAITCFVPFFPPLNLACCLIPFAGALVAVAIYSQTQPRPPVSYNDGIGLGVLTGLIGSVAHAVILIPLVFIFGRFIGGFFARLMPVPSEFPERLWPLMHGIMSNLGGVLAFAVLFRVLGYLGLALVFGILGGVAGAAFFKREAPPAAPPRL